jgi:thiol-disulfide isomerase/thioredoxin
MKRAAVLLATLTAAGPACEKGGDAPGAPVASAGSQEDPAEVGYDIRRLRPRDDEKLADMFDRLRTQALGEGKQVAVLFSADWCESCRRLDLELGSMHTVDEIGHVRILEVKEDDWEAVTRMNEFNALRRRWDAPLNAYPLFVLLDERGEKIEEMKEAVTRMEQEGLEPTVPMWFKAVRG